MSLERELRELDPAWPSTPDVAAAVAGRLEGAPRRRSMRPRLSVPALAALLLACVVAASAAVAPVRAEVRRLLGFAGGERVERVDRAPRAQRPIDLGAPATLDDARRQAGFAIVLPDRLGAPDGVRVGGDLGAGAVSLLYGDDTILSEVPGGSSIGVAKRIGAAVRVRFVDIDGHAGFWVAPGARTLVVPMPSGTAVLRRPAIAGAGVLLWDRGGVAYRLETRRPLVQALAIARSLPSR